MTLLHSSHTLECLRGGVIDTALPIHVSSLNNQVLLHQSPSLIDKCAILAHYWSLIRNYLVVLCIFNRTLPLLSTLHLLFVIAGIG